VFYTSAMRRDRRQRQVAERAPPRPSQASRDARERNRGQPVQQGLENVTAGEERHHRRRPERKRCDGDDPGRGEPENVHVGTRIGARHAAVDPSN
jgi:hypothetical protein